MSHEVARHWRMRHHRLRLEGFKRENEDGTIEVSLSGANWVKKEGNGYHRGENPFEGQVIFQAPDETSIPLELHREVEIRPAAD